MRAALTIAERELAAAFARPRAYVVLGTFLLLLALLSLWVDDVLLGGVASMRRPFAWISVCLLFVVPATTMGLVAEERRSGRLLLLGSLPLTDAELIVGKWASAVGLVGVALVLTLPWPALLAWYGDLELGPVLGGYLGLMLGGAALAALGTAASALVRSQVTAYVLTFAAAAVPWLVGVSLARLPAALVPLAESLSFAYHFDNLARGVLDTRSVVFFVAVAAGFLRLGTHALERQRLA